MPELPEVETVVRDLNKKVLLRTFIGIWTDTNKIIKKPTFEEFEKKIKGKKIEKIWRRGKNIIFKFSGGDSLLIHQKLTGHLLYGVWKLKDQIWIPTTQGSLREKVNTYIHLIFFLDNGKMIALSDLRKFAKVELWDSDELKNELKKLGPEPLEKRFTFEKFKEALKKKKGRIKQVLMDQGVIAGIGNIYSDEVLWRAKVHPLKKVSQIKENELKKIYQSLCEVFLKSIALRGESISDFRDTGGKRGFFDKERRVYRKEGEKCSRCRTIIKRVKIGGRSAHFCPKCQKL